MYIITYSQQITGGSLRVILRDDNSERGNGMPIRFGELTDALRYIQRHNLYETLDGVAVVNEDKYFEDKYFNSDNKKDLPN